MPVTLRDDLDLVSVFRTILSLLIISVIKAGTGERTQRLQK